MIASGIEDGARARTACSQLRNAHIDMMHALVALVVPTVAAQTTVTVSTPAALRGAIAHGVRIEVANDMVIDEEFVIPPEYDVTISSTNGATLFATSLASHFRIDGKLRLENLVLTNGSATYGFCSYNDDGTGETCAGGALHVDEGASLVLVDCVIANSTARYGGGLYAYKSDVEIIRTTFEGNQIRYEAGGALYTQWHNSLKIVESKFLSNSAPKAGALHIGADTYGSTEIFDTEFIGNVAGSPYGWGGEGGAIWLHMGAMTVSGSAFHNNKATKDGPAIHVYPSTGSLTVVSTTFQGNTANGTAAEISYATRSLGPPAIDCAASCDDLGGGTCVPVDCVGCPTGAGPCDGVPCACYSCSCAHPTFPTPQPTGPSPAPTATKAPTVAPTRFEANWWGANAGTTDVAAGSALSPFAVLAAIIVLVANGVESLESSCSPASQ